METLIFKFALFVFSAVACAFLIKKRLVTLCMHFFHLGLMLLPVPIIAEALGYQLVSSVALWTLFAMWWGHITGGILAVCWFGEYLGGPPRTRP